MGRSLKVNGNLRAMQYSVLNYHPATLQAAEEAEKWCRRIKSWISVFCFSYVRALWGICHCRKLMLSACLAASVLVYFFIFLTHVFLSHLITSVSFIFFREALQTPLILSVYGFLSMKPKQTFSFSTTNRFTFVGFISVDCYIWCEPSIFIRSSF